jgi:deoxyribose-phosphate aldolase
MHKYAEDIKRILSDHRTAAANGMVVSQREDTYALLLSILNEENETEADQFPHWNKALASCIDHTILKPAATPDQIETLCEEARLYNFASVCVSPSYVPVCSEVLSGSSIPIGTVIGFPLGASTTAAKVYEVENAAEHGATEFDVVMHVGHLKAGNRMYLEDEIARIVERVKELSPAHIVKVILETCLLTDEEKIAACLIARTAGADFVKTSTGFGSSGATTADVALMRRTVGARMGIKASGGIKTFDDAVDLLRHGANRIGTSSGVTIIHHSLQ